MAETTAQAVDVAAAPALDPAADLLASNADRVLAEHAKAVTALGPARGPGAWLAEEEHARRVAAADAKRDASLDELWTDAEAQAEARVSAAADALAPYSLEPWEYLTGEELGRANALRAFVGETVDGARLPDLADALTARTKGKDRAALAAWLAACYVRYQREDRAALALGRPPRGLAELGAAIAAAVAAVEGPKVAEGRARAKQVEDAALVYRAQVRRLKGERDPRERQRFAARFGLRHTG